MRWGVYAKALDDPTSGQSAVRGTSRMLGTALHEEGHAQGLCLGAVQAWVG